MHQKERKIWSLVVFMVSGRIAPLRDLWICFVFQWSGELLGVRARGVVRFPLFCKNHGSSEIMKVLKKEIWKNFMKPMIYESYFFVNLGLQNLGQSDWNIVFIFLAESRLSGWSKDPGANKRLFSKQNHFFLVAYDWKGLSKQSQPEKLFLGAILSDFWAREAISTHFRAAQSKF